MSVERAIYNYLWSYRVDNDDGDNDGVYPVDQSNRADLPYLIRDSEGNALVNVDILDGENDVEFSSEARDTIVVRNLEVFPDNDYAVEFEEEIESWSSTVLIQINIQSKPALLRRISRAVHYLLAGSFLFHEDDRKRAFDRLELPADADGNIPVEGCDIVEYRSLLHVGSCGTAVRPWSRLPGPHRSSCSKSQAPLYEVTRNLKKFPNADLQQHV